MSDGIGLFLGLAGGAICLFVLFTLLGFCVMRKRRIRRGAVHHSKLLVSFCVLSLYWFTDYLALAASSLSGNHRLYTQICDGFLNKPHVNSLALKIFCEKQISHYSTNIDFPIPIYYDCCLQGKSLFVQNCKILSLWVFLYWIICIQNNVILP